MACMAAIALACSLFLGPADPVAAQTFFGQLFTPAQPDVQTVIEGDADREAEQQRQDEALRRVLNLDSDATQGPVVLEANRIDYDPETEVVIASGNVSVFYAERSLRADEIRYDAAADKIEAKGAIKVVNTDGSVISADEAAFDSEIRDGLIRGAQAVLADGRTRLAAVEARRVDGEYTQLSKAVFSPCDVCESNQTPLWRIRARKIVQDEKARDILYEDATFEVFGVPVAYLPYFSHPDPTVKRRSGFLTPEFRSSEDLGFSIRTSYFQEISPNQDATVGLYAFTRENPVAEGEYRGVFADGSIRIAGSATYATDFETNTLSDASILSGATLSETDAPRGHFDGDARFSIGGGFDIGFDALIASDDTYLRRYRYTDVDRAEARAYAERFTESGFFSSEAIRYQSFRERTETDASDGGDVIISEFAGQIPAVLPHVEFEQSFDAPLIGGAFSIGGDTLFLTRNEGRDVARFSGTFGWSRQFATSAGVLLRAGASARGDLYKSFTDDGFDDGVKSRVLPQIDGTISWPLARRGERGDHVIEPLANVVIAPYGGNPSDIPNEDSQDIELDELNIFAIDRVSGLDIWEEGPRATLGLRYAFFGHNGLEGEATIGQSFRPKSIDTFSENAGLNDTLSDVVGAWRITNAPFYTIGQRFRVSDGLEVERSEFYAQAQAFDRLRLSTAYVFLDKDDETGATEDRQEASFAAGLDITDNWSIAGDLRRDIQEDEFVNGGGALRYANECCEVDLTLSRRFTETEDLDSSTDVGLVVRLKGLGSQ